ncbi:hypothetical protein [Treponema pedis]|uniref:hypothetical protein n=1 Tax=Treponema pedis TaxID=409322 RepID=UPI003D1BAFC8
MQIALPKNAVEFVKQTRIIVCTFSGFACKSAAILQSSEFENSCGCRIYRNAYFRQCRWHCLKTLPEFVKQTRIIVCTFSGFALQKCGNSPMLDF